MDILPHARIPVQQGDVMGVHYSGSAREEDGVVPYEDSTFPETTGFAWTLLSRIHNADWKEENLVPGVSILTGRSENVLRLPALKVIVDGNSKCELQKYILPECVELHIKPCVYKMIGYEIILP